MVSLYGEERWGASGLATGKERTVQKGVTGTTPACCTPSRPISHKEHAAPTGFSYREHREPLSWVLPNAISADNFFKTEDADAPVRKFGWKDQRRFQNHTCFFHLSIRLTNQCHPYDTRSKGKLSSTEPMPLGSFSSALVETSRAVLAVLSSTSCRLPSSPYIHADLIAERVGI